MHSRTLFSSLLALAATPLLATSVAETTHELAPIATSRLDFLATAVETSPLLTRRHVAGVRHQLEPRQTRPPDIPIVTPAEVPIDCPDGKEWVGDDCERDDPTGWRGHLWFRKCARRDDDHQLVLDPADVTELAFRCPWNYMCQSVPRAAAGDDPPTVYCLELWRVLKHNDDYRRKQSGNGWLRRVGTRFFHQVRQAPAGSKSSSLIVPLQTPVSGAAADVVASSQQRGLQDLSRKVLTASTELGVSGRTVSTRPPRA